MVLAAGVVAAVLASAGVAVAEDVEVPQEVDAAAAASADAEAVVSAAGEAHREAAVASAVVVAAEALAEDGSLVSKCEALRGGGFLLLDYDSGVLVCFALASVLAKGAQGCMYIIHSGYPKKKEQRSSLRA